MADKKRYGVGALTAALVIGLVIGGAAGFGAGSLMRKNASEDMTSYAADEEAASVEVQDETVVAADSEDETSTEIVMTIDGSEIYMDEINTRLYMIRDSYVSQYGEEPWDIQLDSGMTVGQQAKEDLLDQLTREIILAERGSDYGIDGLSDEETTDCQQRAEDYMASLGQDIADQFGITYASMVVIYERETLEMDVYNAILSDLETGLREEYPDASDTEMDEKMTEAFDELYSEWKDAATIRTEDAWEYLEIGTMG